MKQLVMILGLSLTLFGCSSDGDGDGGGTGGGGGAAGGGNGIGPVAPLGIECGLLGNDATFPFEFNVDLAAEPVIGQPVDATVSVSLVFSADLACGILAAGFTSVDIESGSDTVTITGVSAPDPAEVTVTLPGTPVTGLQFADGCGCADPGEELVPPCGTGPGLEFNFDPETVSVTPDGASTMDFLLTLDGVDLNLANLAGDIIIPELNVPGACSYGFIGADLDGDEEYNSLATPPLQIQFPVLCGGVDCDDDNDCTADACVEGSCNSTNVADDVPCNAGAGFCQAGTCIDRCEGVDCNDDNECTDDACNPVAWLRQAPNMVNLCENTNLEDGTECDEGVGMCMSGMCLNMCSGVDCDDQNECTIDGECDLETGECPEKTNQPDDTPCADDTGTCQAGTCVLRCADAATRCDDGDDCTDLDCDPSDGQCLFSPLTGNSCTVDDASGVCNAGVCEIGGLCDDAATRCDDGNECTQNLCDPGDGVCSNPQVADDTLCAGGAGTCQSGTCDLDPVEAEEFLAVDCALLGNSASIPIDSLVDPEALAVEGVPLDVTPQETIVLPADLVCGFLTAGFVSAEVANSNLSVTMTNATPGSVALTDFLDDGSDSPNLVSPHAQTLFDFATACGCASPPPGDLVPPCGTGPGIVVPFLANAPGTIPPGTDPVTITPGSGSTVDFLVTYDGLALELRNLKTAFTIPAVCLGGACPANEACAPENRDTIPGDDSADDSPRIMYDASCNKAQADAGDCVPFDDFAGVADVCVGRTPTSPVDPDICTDSATCCAAIETLFPTATPAQQPQLNVSPAP